MRNKYLNSIIFFLLSTIVVFSQVDTRGKEFWLTFPPNFHNQSNNDSLVLYFSAEKPTSVVIEYRDRNSFVRTRTVNIINPNQVYSFGVSDNEYELRGQNYLSNLGNSWDCERVSPIYFKVTSTEDISLYAFSRANLSCDAMMVLPTKGLGKDYINLSYKSDFRGENNSKTPSQFVILATEDNTIVTIRPTGVTPRNGLRTQNITLDAGESYLVQVSVNENTRIDLTGTIIESNRNIAVFTGHQRATVPSDLSLGNSSRDMLLEQMIPTQFWGRNGFVTPFVTLAPSETDRNGYDIYRVIAANDSTEIYINGEFYQYLNKGGFFENRVEDALSIEASGPICVAMYEQTSNYSVSSFGSDNIGDPFMLIQPPKEQFSRIYRVLNLQYIDNENNNAYTQQYLNIIAPNTTLSSIRIDGIPISASLFRPIPSSSFSFYNARVTDGVHDVLANEEIGIIVYGLGEANSYGYLGGMSVKQIDFNPPQIFTTQRECSLVNVLALDTANLDDGIFNITLDSLKSTNVELILPNYNKGDKQVKFSLKLLDSLNDGFATVIVKDSIGYYKKKLINIPGYTITSPNLNSQSIVYDTVAYGKQICKDVPFTNYGKFSQTIKAIRATNSDFYISGNDSITIAPGETRNIRVCYQAKSKLQLTDSIKFVYLNGSICNEFTLPTFSVISDNDTIAPKITTIKDKCRLIYSAKLFDNFGFNTGIDSIYIKSQENIIYDLINMSETGNILVEPLDPAKDSYYTIVIKDKAGNELIYSDTIPGYTLSIALGQKVIENISVVDKSLNGNFNCDNLKITNYGTKPQLLDSVYLKYNINFSYSKSSFPLLLNPGESYDLRVCFEPNFNFATEVYNDTLLFKLGCKNFSLPLYGINEPLMINSESRCGLVLKYAENAYAGFEDFTYSPNPVVDELTLDIVSNINGNTEFTLIDVYGNKTFLLSKVIKKGANSLKLDVKNFIAGVYFVEMKNAQGSRYEKIIIQK
jgi:hypothetical protein